MFSTNTIANLIRLCDCGYMSPYIWGKTSLGNVIKQASFWELSLVSTHNWGLQPACQVVVKFIQYPQLRFAASLSSYCSTHFLWLYTDPDCATFVFQGFGVGNFKSLFEAIETEQAERGNLWLADDRYRGCGWINP